MSTPAADTGGRPASCLYEGMVRHRRFEPIDFGFRYRIQLLYLDLAEIGTLFGDNRIWSCEGRTPVSFRRADHLGSPDESLDESVRRLVETRLGFRPTGPIRLLTGPRYFGLAFNPVSFYYCFDARGEDLEAFVAEVSNTPWGERHAYVLDLPERTGRRNGTRAQRIPKEFHVSPFMDMAMHYDWRVRIPGRSLQLTVKNDWRDRAPHSDRDFDAPYFQADLSLTRVEINRRHLSRAFRQAPFHSGRIVAAIYWQAFRLAWRRIRFVRHPEQRWPRSFSDPALMNATSADPRENPS